MQHHALQCGFCTPGFLMLAVALLEQDPDPGDADLRDAFCSSLCRCTGYQNILKAVSTAAAAMKARSTSVERSAPQSEEDR
jgi:carbon-monoxide dehydrogenase small subunit